MVSIKHFWWLASHRNFLNLIFPWNFYSVVSFSLRNINGEESFIHSDYIPKKFVNVFIECQKISNLTSHISLERNRGTNLDVNFCMPCYFSIPCTQPVLTFNICESDLTDIWRFPLTNSLHCSNLSLELSIGWQHFSSSTLTVNHILIALSTYIL